MKNKEMYANRNQLIRTIVLCLVLGIMEIVSIVNSITDGRTNRIIRASVVLVIICILVYATIIKGKMRNKIVISQDGIKMIEQGKNKTTGIPWDKISYLGESVIHIDKMLTIACEKLEDGESYLTMVEKRKKIVEKIVEYYPMDEG